MFINQFDNDVDDDDVDDDGNDVNDFWYLLGKLP